VHGVLGLAALCLAGVLPALALAGCTATAPFLVPLATAAVASAAAIAEFVVGGSIGLWFAVAATIVDVVAAAALVRRFQLRRIGEKRPDRSDPDRRRSAAPDPARRVRWGTACVVVVAVGVMWPLVALRAPVIGFDTQAIWLLHTALVWAGHNAMVNGFTAKAYRLSNPSYPPLIPASGAMVYSAIGHIDQRLAVGATVVLNASAIGVVSTGLLRLVPAETPVPRRVAAAVIVVAFAGAVFGISGQFALNGYADTLWSAAAAAAVVFGLVLPRERRHLLTAWLCIVVASSTKSEGFFVCVVISVLVGLRYLHRPTARDDGPVGVGRLVKAGVDLGVRGWVEWAAMSAAPLVPGAAWIVVSRLHGITDPFFASSATESLPTRLAATGSAMASNISLAPGALAVLILGVLVLRPRRARLGLAGPGWLWVVAVVGALVIGATYVLGSIEIHWWLATSVTRTTVFDQTACLVDMTIWLLILVAAPSRRLPVAEDGAQVVRHDRRATPHPPRQEAVVS